MSDMQNDRRQFRDDLTWAGRRDQMLVAFGWFAAIVILLWLASHVTQALLILVIAAIIAYALAPAVVFFTRFMPRPLAMMCIYLLLLLGLVGLGYLVITATITQVSMFGNQIGSLLAPGPHGEPSELYRALERLGLTKQQIDSYGQQLTQAVQNALTSLVPILQNVLNSALDIVLIIVLSIYLLIDGRRVTDWLRNGSPVLVRHHVNAFYPSMQRVIGGYIRGQLIMSSLIGVLVGVGMFVLGVPDSALLGMLAFILEFIPVLGTLTSGAICVLVALTQGWEKALIVLVYFIIVHIIEGDIVGPRILGRAIGLHPVVSLIALIAGGELFGIAGALFASPVAGLLQAVLLDF